MDPLSHALLGAATGLSISRSTRRLAALAGAGARLLPDARCPDQLRHLDPLLTLEYHRHSHPLVRRGTGGGVGRRGRVVALAAQACGRGSALLAGTGGNVKRSFSTPCTSYGTQLPVAIHRPALRGERPSRSSIRLVTQILLAGVALGLRAGVHPGVVRDRASCHRPGGGLSGLGLGAARAGRSPRRKCGSGAWPCDQPHEVKPTWATCCFGAPCVERGGVRHRRSAGRVLGAAAFTLAARCGGLSRATSFRRSRPTAYRPWMSHVSPASSELIRTHPSHPLVIGDVRYAMLPDSTRPLWGIEIDPGASTACRIPYLRDFPRKDRQRFSRDAARPWRRIRYEASIASETSRPWFVVRSER